MRGGLVGVSRTDGELALAVVRLGQVEGKDTLHTQVHQTVDFSITVPSACQEKLHSQRRHGMSA